MDIKGRTFLVIGGAGLIGSHVVDLLLQEGAGVLVCDNLTRGSMGNLSGARRNPGFDFIKRDISHAETLSRALAGVDGVFHLAALWLNQCEENPRHAFDVNVRGTFNVLQACAEHGKRLVFSSSASVYGDAVKEPMAEDHPFNFRNIYGATKVCNEALATAFHHRDKLSFAGLRYMNVYGPRQDYKGAYIAVIMKMLDDIESGKGPTIYGTGEEAFDFVYVGDCARANILAMQSDATGFYNVGTGTKTTLRELAETLLRLTGNDLPINYAGNNIRKDLVKNRIGCPEKAAREIGFTAETKLEDGLRRLIAWRRACAG